MFFSDIRRRNYWTLKSRVYRFRKDEYGEMKEALLKYSEFSETDRRSILIFNNKVKLPSGEFTHMSRFAHPALVIECTGYPLNVFIDCTFHVIPVATGFKQMMVIIIFLPKYKLYVPVFFVLLQSKQADFYRLALQSCISAANWRFNALSITCDFEKGLIDAVKFNFADAVSILCWFHFKQAIRRKLLVDFHIPRDMVSEFLNIQTVVSVDEIIVKAIPYIRHKFYEKTYFHKFEQFWNYFIKMRMKTYDPKQRNINHIISNEIEDADSVFNNRTNNPLERFNRVLNDELREHPTVAGFITNLKEIIQKYLDIIARIKGGKILKTKHKKTTVTPMPDDYLNWQCGFER